MTYTNVQDLTQGDVINLGEVIEELDTDFEQTEENSDATVTAISVEGEEIYVVTDKGTFSAFPNYPVQIFN